MKTIVYLEENVMRKIKLTKYEREIEEALERGEYKPVSKKEFDRISKLLEEYKKDTVLHMRVNEQVLKKIKAKAKKLGVKYQTFISEILHRIAHS